MKTLIIDLKFNKKYFERVIHHEVFHIINDGYKELFDFFDIHYCNSLIVRTIGNSQLALNS